MENPYWPPLPYADWAETCTALHLWSQIVGKYRLTHTPWLNHSWHATLTVNANGLTTGLVPDAGGLEVCFDFRSQELRILQVGGEQLSFPLEAMSVAQFHDRFCAAVSKLGGDSHFDGMPNEVPDAIPFKADDRPRPYDSDAVSRFHRALVTVSLVFQQFRTGFIGKASPIHLFWGSFDLAVTRFSGRRAPLHGGGVPNLPDDVTQEAYSHEESSAGFWPGGGGMDEPAFYSYGYPAPPGFAQAVVSPREAYFHEGLGEFILPYDAVRQAAAPEAALLSFLNSSYRAVADLGNWDRAALECPLGAPLTVRPIG
jgi:hypothetical protein